MTEVYTTQEQMLAAISLLYAEVRTTTWVSLHERAAASELEGILQTLMGSASVVERVARRLDEAGRIECVRTGASVFLEPHNRYAHGDLFRVGSTLVLKAATASYNPGPVNAVFSDYEDWAAQDRRHFIAQPGMWRWLGYDAVVL